MKPVLRDSITEAVRVLGQVIVLSGVAFACYTAALSLGEHAGRFGLSDTQTEGLVYGFAALLALYLGYGEVASAVRRRRLASGTESPATLPERFAAVAERLSATAQELQELQAEVAAQTAMARQLATQADERRRRMEQDRALAEEYKEAAEAVERLLQTRVDKVARVFERSNRRTQVLYLALGAILGYLVQVIGQLLG